MADTRDFNAGPDLVATTMVPDGAGPFPFVVVQHDMTRSRSDAEVVRVMAAARQRGVGSVAFDAWLHGTRYPYHRRLRHWGDPPTISDRYPEDLDAVLAAMFRELPLDDRRLGFVGFGMGANWGLASISRGSRFAAAVLCCPEALSHADHERLRRDARASTLKRLSLLASVRPAPWEASYDVFHNVSPRPKLTTVDRSDLEVFAATVAEDICGQLLGA